MGSSVEGGGVGGVGAVLTTGDDTRKQGGVEISNFPISLRDGLVTDVSFVCEFKVNSFVFDVLTSGVFLNLIGI